uniref:uncharacterized protein LOC125906916 n=1 Tax=Anopheles coluzzii TaxID=1518534 RepID=UPI0020FFCC30|nr:uncharacterized protein LOC120951179 isoform X1 [Anopheles coluzzii]XP_049463858.1 uncharacterized protein LOC125906916 [Anopheles coluzzii]XP_049467105.1 uncharacterized protein LOC125908412 [Anopheles coluzzii]
MRLFFQVSSSIDCMAALLQTMEDRIGSLEREVKMGNLKLSRMEEKLDEQTRLLSMLIEQTVAARQPNAERHSANEDEVQEQVPQPSSEEHNAKNETEEDQDDEQERHEEHEAAPEIPVLPIRTVNDFFVLNSSCARNEEFVQQMAEELQQEVVASQTRARNVSQEAIDVFLLTYRSTPNKLLENQKTPADVMFNRRIRTTLELLRSPPRP